MPLTKRQRGRPTVSFVSPKIDEPHEDPRDEARGDEDHAVGFLGGYAKERDEGREDHADEHAEAHHPDGEVQEGLAGESQHGNVTFPPLGSLLVCVSQR